MRVPAGLYMGKNGREWLAVYNYQHDVSIKLPPQYKRAKHLAHFSYSKGGKKGGVDIFQFRGKVPDLKDIATIRKGFKLWGKGVAKAQTNPAQEVYIDAGALRGAEEEYDIQAEIRRDAPQEVEKEVTRLTIGDIFEFCRDKTAKNPRGPRTRHVSRIAPITTARYIEPKKIITGGKQWTVPECILEGNIDYGQGCISGWIPGGKNASFDGKVFEDWFSYRWGECAYPCYAERKHRCPPKTIYKFDEQKLRKELEEGAMIDFDDYEKPLGRPIEILRFGKRTEPWTPWSQDSFVRTLETMTETGTRGIITTRFLPFDKEIAKLLRKTKSVLLYSIGISDEYELGACEHGCDTEFRLEQEVKYNKAKVNSSRYLMIIAHLPPTERDKRIIKLGHRTQLLPVRFKNRFATENITGQTWNHLKGGEKARRQDGIFVLDQDLENYGSYVYNGNELMVKTERIHPEWIKLIMNNKGRIRMCHHDDRTLYCGGCFQRPGIITEERKSPKPRTRSRPSSRPKKEKEQKPIIQKGIDNLDLWRD